MRGDIEHIEHIDDLVSYAATAQIQGLRAQGIAQNVVAKKIGMDKGNLSRRLLNPDSALLRQLDGVIVTHDHTQARAGGLDALSVRLRGIQGTAGPATRVSPTWAAELLERPADDEFDVLTQGSALLSLFQAGPDQAGRLCDRYRKELLEVVDRLILVGASPPTPRNVEALILLGNIAGYAFELMKGSLQSALRKPLGFRVWRAVTTVVQLNHDNGPPPLEMRDWVQTQLSRAEELRVNSLFAARSLDLETAIAIPPAWSPPDRDWVAAMLRKRAENPDAVVRERGTAAAGLWERAVTHQHPDLEETRRYLLDLVARFRQEAAAEGQGMVGMRWVAATLQQCLETGEAVCNSWPDSNEPCLRIVEQAAGYLDSPEARVPEAIRQPTKTLMRHAVLQNAGVHRRSAIDALLAGGYALPVTRALGRILDNTAAEPWLRCRVLFAVSFLQQRDHDVVASMLRDACRHASGQLLNSRNERGVVSEAHAVLFALGDCFGVPSVKEQAAHLRAELSEPLKDFERASKNPERLFRVSRALAYLVTVTAQSDDGSSWETLTRLQSHADKATKDLAFWALEQRFDKDRKVRPFYASRWVA